MAVNSGFNPYSVGSTSGRIIFFVLYIVYHRVSILILLEIYKEVREVLTTGFQESGFNPYSSGSISGRYILAAGS